MMKKRSFAFLLALCLLMSLLPAASAADEVPAPEEAAAPAESAESIVITDAEGLRAISANPGGSYALGANINMEGVEWKPFAFSGQLDGRGYSIYNLTLTVAGDERFTAVDGNLKQYDTLGVGLFSSMKNAGVSNLGILNAEVKVISDQHCFAAILCGAMEDSTLEQVKVSGRVELTSYAQMVGVAGMCGFGSGAMTGCSADVTLVHIDNLTTARCEQFTGGLLATGYATFDNCFVKIAGYTSCHGYVHDGGMVGMHFRYFDASNPESVFHTSHNCRTEGFITFFEDNLDRRAYCKADCGENLYGTLNVVEFTDSFERREVSDYSVTLLPHSCEEPAYTSAVTEPGCEEFGYTTYTCTACGYSYTDDFTAPGHAEGEWKAVKEATQTEPGEKQYICTRCSAVLESAEIPPHVAGEWEVDVASDYQTPGREVRRCTDCGEVLEERELPPLVRTERIELSEREVKLRYKGTLSLSAEVSPSNADDQSVSWSSSNTDVASVGSSGLVLARSVGDTVITCTANDGGAEGSCTVHVRYTFPQQLIRIFLLGFLWY